MDIRTVGIVGAGTMGSGIATNLAQAGLAVMLVDARPGAAAGTVGQAKGFYARAVEKGRMDGVADLASVDLVIKAVFEDFDLKARLFGELSAFVSPDTLIATNTSCLRVSDLARHVSGPARFLGLHYFSPAAVNPTVEVVQGEATSDSTIEAALA